MRIGFNKRPFALFIFVLLLEICIALFVRDRFIRPFVGDVLVVILIYSFVRVFLDGPPNRIAISVFAFACLVELGQYLNLVSLLQLQDSQVASIIIGSTFDWKDILAYGVGTAIVIVADRTQRARPAPAVEQN
jgi:hypothetical protein